MKSVQDGEVTTAAFDEALVAAVRAVPLFQHLADGSIFDIMATGEIVSRAAGETVFLEGDPADKLYVVIEGTASVYRQQGDDPDVTITSVGPGGFFGELALLDGGARSASVRAATDATFLTVERGAFLTLLAASPVLLDLVIGDLTSKIRTTTEMFFRDQLTAQAIQLEMERDRNRALAQMVAGMAHEINTPLGIVNTAGSILRRQLTSEEVGGVLVKYGARDDVEDLTETLSLMSANIDRISALVQNFKNLSVSQTADRAEEFDLPKLVEEILDLYRISAREAGLVISVVDELPADQRTWTGYRGYLAQVLLNLVTNVERYAYADDSGGAVEVELRSVVEQGSPWFAISVRDFGRGIEPDTLPRVFEPFFTTGRSKGGTGLGLSIVENLVSTALRGRVAIESTLGVGTTVTATVPQRISEPETRGE